VSAQDHRARWWCALKQSVLFLDDMLATSQQIDCASDHSHRVRDISNKPELERPRVSKCVIHADQFSG